MRLIATKTLNFLNRNDQQSFRKYLGPSMESLNADFLQFSAKIIRRLVLSSYLGISL